MSTYDYIKSRELVRIPGVTFYALIMAAMRQADTDNEAKLREAWPDVWEELKELYNTPGVLSAKSPEAPPTFQECAEATMLFHSGSPWTEAKRLRWKELTGQDEATTRALCDMCRRASGITRHED